MNFKVSISCIMTHFSFQTPLDFNFWLCNNVNNIHFTFFFFSVFIIFNSVYFVISCVILIFFSLRSSLLLVVVFMWWCAAKWLNLISIPTPLFTSKIFFFSNTMWKCLHDNISHDDDAISITTLIFTLVNCWYEVKLSSSSLFFNEICHLSWR